MKNWFNENFKTIIILAFLFAVSVDKVCLRVNMCVV